MWKCDVCDLMFETFQAKANHIRWKHKEKAYTDEGLVRIQANAQATAIKRYGTKTTVTEERMCACGTKFTVTYSPERKGHVKKTCSKACAARRKQTPEMLKKKSASMKLTLASNPELKAFFLSKLSGSVRTSSKVERALAEALRPHGFKRHKQVTAEGLTFDVDIVSTDGRVWVESDGSWHFKQVHEGHNFDATRARDTLEEQEAIKHNVCLIRVNNETMTIDEQVAFIIASMTSWNGVTGKVIKSWEVT